MRKPEHFTPPPADVITWIEYPRSGVKPAFFAPDALFLPDGIISFSVVSRILKHSTPAGNSARFYHPSFRILYGMTVEGTTNRYEFWASWPVGFAYESTKYYYPTRYLLVRIANETNEAGQPIASVLLETCPAKRFPKARQLFRAAVTANATHEEATGKPVGANGCVSIGPAIDAFRVAGSIGVLHFDQTTSKIERTEYLPDGTKRTSYI